MGYNLYQLKADHELVGAVIKVDGDYDDWGVVLSHQPNGYASVRGLGKHWPKQTKAQAERVATQNVK